MIIKLYLFLIMAVLLLVCGTTLAQIGNRLRNIAKCSAKRKAKQKSEETNSKIKNIDSGKCKVGKNFLSH